MNILEVCPRYFPNLGGVEYVVKSVAERLAAQGHGVTVLAGEPKINEPCLEWLNGVKVIKWPTYAPGDAYHFPKRRRKLREFLMKAEGEYDVVHVHSVHSILSIYSLSILKNSKIRKVITPYYHGAGHTFLRRILWRGWRRHVQRALAWVDAIHTVSKLEAQLVERDFGMEALPIENGVDERLFKFSWLPSNYVIYSGRIEKYKNIHRLARIVKILNERFGMDLELKVFGSGPYRKSLNEYLADLGLKYALDPPQPFEKYIEHLSRAMFLGLLSEKESYPQSVNEANAIGVPTVVVKPWGENFAERTRTLVVALDMSDDKIARKIVFFLDEAQRLPKPPVPTWTEVVQKYVSKLYLGKRQIFAKRKTIFCSERHLRR